MENRKQLTVVLHIVAKVYDRKQLKIVSPKQMLEIE